MRGLRWHWLRRAEVFTAKLTCAVALSLASAATCVAQTQAQPPTPPAVPAQQIPAAGKPYNPAVVITLEQAIELAKTNNPSLQAQRTLVYQNKEQEVTANLRPNPTLSWDAQYLPIFSPNLASSDYLDTTAQFDLGAGYLFERGRKRQHRLQAAHDATSVTEARVLESQRTTVAGVAQQFVAALLAKSNLDFAEHLLDSYQHTVGMCEEQQKSGTMSKADVLKVQLQTLQFQNDVTSARIAMVRALNTLRELIGFDSVPRVYDIAGQLSYEPITAKVEDLQAKALSTRPDLQAAQRSVTAANSRIALSQANAKQDVSATFDYTHVSGANLAALYFSIPMPIFNRNQGEVARHYYVLAQSQWQAKAAEQAVVTDVKNAYETLLNDRDVLQLYDKGYRNQAQQSLDMAQSSFANGSASLLDFLDAERSYRSTELSYRQALASYMTSLEQLRFAVGTRELQ
jgi:outer membrane protein, heavy metal efflux system